MTSIDTFVQITTTSKPDKRVSKRRGFGATVRSFPYGLALAWLVLATVLAWAFLPWLFTAYDPLQGIPGGQLKAPSAVHLLGTDSLGRDLFARIVYGAVHSLTGAIAAVGVGLVVGSALGLVAGSVRGRIDEALMRLVDVLLSIPTLLLSLSIIILLGFGTFNAAIAVGATAIAGFARLMRSEVVRVRNAEFVEAAFGSGGTFGKVLWRHILPNSLVSVVAYTAVQFGWAILQISTLGFLGYGAPPPTPEWGLLIAEGRNYLATAWWLTAAPGLVVVAVVLSANRVSQSIGRSTR
ncbi:MULTISPECIES: ABC transporter permease [unclassified Rhizobium]|uniref:ABC transporter permease n=1 Tax=unclassified Rhizobium TaxID=2613769 RepID=UPI000BD71F3A|nr:MULTISPECIES: ABC transporter permease [unclassified Rhizobium]MDH7808800.1 peptide/nickel transport system permease protein [Rhizobium sp. AN67]SOD50963.1 peptide/nickel transport system permease protein [Rhizobium sp. AN6A]